MANIYSVGRSENILYEVSVGTVGAALSEFLINDIPIIESVEDGIIPKTIIGLSDNLLGFNAVTVTIIDLSHIPIENRESSVNEIFFRVTLDGSSFGPQDYDLETTEMVVSRNKRLVLITSQIEFIYND